MIRLFHTKIGFYRIYPSDFTLTQHYTQIDTDKELPAELKFLASNYIASIYRDKQNNLWISTDKNLWYLELGVDGQIKDYYKLKKIQNPPSTLLLTCKNTSVQA